MTRRIVLESNSVNALTDWMVRRSYKQNFPCVIVGDPQTFKSTLMLTLGHNIDPTFSIDRIAFTASKFVNLVNNPTLGRGNVIVLEEAGVNVARGEWYSFLNKMILYVSQTYGYRGLIVFFTLPSLGLLDSRVAKLLKGYIETIGGSKKTQKILFKFQTIEARKKIAIKGKEIYYYRPMTYVNGMLCQVTHFEADFPDSEMLKEYYRISEEYKDQLAQSLERESIKADSIVEPFNFEKGVEDILIKRGVRNFLDTRNKWNIAKICAVESIGTAKAKVLVEMVQEKMREINMPMPEVLKSVKVKYFSDTPIKEEKDISGAKWAGLDDKKEG